jgi:hypothetical protein
VVLILMVRRRSCAVSNHEDARNVSSSWPSFETLASQAPQDEDRPRPP